MKMNSIISHLSLSFSPSIFNHTIHISFPPPPPPAAAAASHIILTPTRTRTITRTRRPTSYSFICFSSSHNPVTDGPPHQSASDVIIKFYDGINRHDITSLHHLIAQNCVYEDLIFPRPFVGREEILQFFKRFNDSISTDLQFVIDGLSTTQAQDSSAVGVLWHLEWKGRPFPFSKGCSFYCLDGNTQIVYARDSVEPAIKPGEMALIAIRGVTWLLERFPQLIDRI